MNLNLGSLGMWLQKNRYALSISAGLACSLCLFYREVQDSEGWCHTVEKSASHQCDNMFPDSSLRDQPDSTCPMCRCAIATTSVAGAAGAAGGGRRSTHSSRYKRQKPDPRECTKGK